MSDDFIPTTDDKFDAFQTHFVATVTANPGTYGHTAADVTALTAAQTTWKQQFGIHTDAHIAAEQATKAKEKARTAFEEVIRSSTRKVNAIPTVDNALRATLDLPSHATTRTKAPAPTTRPLVHTNDPGGHRQIVHWVDETTPHSRKKPDGVEAAEVFLKIGDPAPADETTCILVARDTATPYMYEFQTTDVGKTAYWFLRWVNHANQHGPLSVLVSAKINP